VAAAVVAIIMMTVVVAAAPRSARVSEHSLQQGSSVQTLGTPVPAQQASTWKQAITWKQDGRQALGNRTAGKHLFPHTSVRETNKQRWGAQLVAMVVIMMTTMMTVAVVAARARAGEHDVQQGCLQVAVAPLRER